MRRPLTNSSCFSAALLTLAACGGDSLPDPATDSQSAAVTALFGTPHEVSLSCTTTVASATAVWMGLYCASPSSQWSPQTTTATSTSSATVTFLSERTVSYNEGKDLTTEWEVALSPEKPFLSMQQRGSVLSGGFATLFSAKDGLATLRESVSHKDGIVRLSLTRTETQSSPGAYYYSTACTVTQTELRCEGSIDLATQAEGEANPSEESNSDNESEDDAAPSPLEANALVAGQLVITEFMANPAICADSVGEWIEIFNATTSPIQLNNLVVGDATATRAKVQSDRVLEPGEYAVLARGSASTFCGSFTPDAYYGSNLSLNNDKDTIALYAAETNILIDGIAAYTSQGAKSGVSFALISAPSATTNDGTSSWSATTTKAPGASEFGTPGASNF